MCCCVLIATIIHTLFGRNQAGAGPGTTGHGRHVIDSSSPLQCFGGGVIAEALLYVGSCVGGARHPPKDLVSLSPKTVFNSEGREIEFVLYVTPDS